NDTRIRAVRLWSQSSHNVVWSSVASEQLGVANALNDADIDNAVAAAGAPTWIATSRSPGNAPAATRFYAYSALGPQPLVAQFEYLDSELTSDVRAAWLGYQIALGVGLLLTLTLALLSMREPKAKIGAGVPFYPESVPSYMAVMDADRAVAIEQAGDRIKERVGGLQQKLEESESARLRAEGQLQQAPAALNTPGHRMPVPQTAIEPPAPAVAPGGGGAGAGGSRAGPRRSLCLGPSPPWSNPSRSPNRSRSWWQSPLPSSPNHRRSRARSRNPSRALGRSRRPSPRRRLACRSL